jgi:hypothetical protein
MNITPSMKPLRKTLLKLLRKQQHYPFREGGTLPAKTKTCNAPAQTPPNKRTALSRVYEENLAWRGTQEVSLWLKNAAIL